SSSCDEQENHIPSYYKGNRQLPVISPAILSDFSNNGVVPFLLSAEKSHSRLIATTHPIRVENKACFLVDLDRLQDPEDLLCDDLGSWNQSKTSVKKYQLGRKNGHVTKIIKQPDYADGRQSVFRRTFLVFVRYYFEGAPEHSIQLKPHGSAKSGCAIPYLRTYRSTMSEMATAVSGKEKSLKRVVQQIEDDDKATYITLFQKITARLPGVKAYLQAYCTDGELALREAFGQEFERSVSFLCKLHVKQNIKEKCSKLQMSKAATEVIVNDIFGSEGLVHASEKTEYWAKVEELKRKWDTLEQKDTRRDPQFATYFVRHKADEVWNHLSAKVSREAGFGDEVQCNNVSEYVNAVRK
ncbi:unnamed protein product, partial [Porites evermanni]